jgi:hypothetical protein
MDSGTQSSFPRVLVAGLVAPLAAPLFTFIAASLYLNLSGNSAELGRWIRPSDLWPMHLFVLGLALVGTWCLGCPVFLFRRRRNRVTGLGMCALAGVVSAPVLSLPLILLPGGGLLGTLAALMFGMLPGIAVGGVFSFLAGIPWDTPYSRFLQRDR